MDKLEPILKQKFWIILGVGMIMTITGWWMATGALAKTITDRRTAIEGAEKAIPSATGELPNEDWKRKLSEINTRQEEMVTVVRRALWEQQRAVMTWPETVEEFVKDLPYRGEIDDVTRDLYRTSYPFEIEKYWRRVRPIELDGTGIVAFGKAGMPIKKNIVGELAPKTPEIWDAQEDLWLVAPILDAIKEVNGGDNGTRLDAAIHVIEKLELMGGERTTGDSTAASPSGDAAMMSGMPEGYTGGFAGDSGGGGGPSGGRNAGKTQSADFNPEEEFGNTGRESRGGGGGYGGGGPSMDAEGMMDAMSGGGGGGGAVEAPTIDRYVDDDESAPFKSRGFYLSVIMDHRKVPVLLAQLTAGGSSPWPIEIVRVQMSRLNPDDAEGRSLGGGMMAGGPMMGPGPMGPGAAFGADAAFSNTAMPADQEEYLEDASSGAGASGFGPGFGDTGASSGRPTGPLAGKINFDAALQDAVVAKVAIAGVIYMYRPVDPPAATEGAPTEGTPTDGAAPAEPLAETPTETPTDPAGEAAPTDPAMVEGEVAPTDPAATDPAATDPAAVPADPAATAPGEGTPTAEPTEPAPNEPAPAEPTPAEPGPASTEPPAAPPEAAPQ